MEDKIIYKCRGTCGGVSNTPGVCQDKNCTHSGKSLEKHVQCEDCVDKTKKTERSHGCDCCKRVE